MLEFIVFSLRIIYGFNLALFGYINYMGCWSKILVSLFIWNSPHVMCFAQQNQLLFLNVVLNWYLTFQ